MSEGIFHPDVFAVPDLALNEHGRGKGIEVKCVGKGAFNSLLDIKLALGFEDGDGRD